MNTEKHEHVIDVINRIKAYLQETGFSSPLIFPVCSRLSLEIRQVQRNSGKMTMSEVRSCYSSIYSFVLNLFVRHYKSTLTRRKQTSLHYDICYWRDHIDEYKTIWTTSSLFSEIYGELENEAVLPLNTLTYRIGDSFHTNSELDLINILTGVPCLERYLEKRLFSVSGEDRKDDHVKN